MQKALRSKLTIIIHNIQTVNTESNEIIDTNIIQKKIKKIRNVNKFGPRKSNLLLILVIDVIWIRLFNSFTKIRITKIGLLHVDFTGHSFSWSF